MVVYGGGSLGLVVVHGGSLQLSAVNDFRVTATVLIHSIGLHACVVLVEAQGAGELRPGNCMSSYDGAASRSRRCHGSYSISWMLNRMIAVQVDHNDDDDK